jgi:hypothetical protein
MVSSKGVQGTAVRLEWGRIDIAPGRNGKEMLIRRHSCGLYC